MNNLLSNRIRNKRRGVFDLLFSHPLLYFSAFIILTLLIGGIFILHKNTSGGKRINILEDNYTERIDLYYNFDTEQVLYKPTGRYEEPFKIIEVQNE